MISIDKTKEKIIGIVDDYKLKNPEEYTAVCDYINNNRKTLDNEFASMKGEHALKRKSHEIPETLSNLIIKDLDEKELVWFSTLEGARWFIKKYPEFMTGETY